MTTRQRWALTFLLETYLNIKSEMLYFYDGTLTNYAIKECLRLLLKENVITLQELSQELREHYGVNFIPQQLKRFVNGNFEIVLIQKKED